jgi:hypothetical protein
MSYRSKKGWQYEHETAKMLCALFPDIRFVNVGGAEKTRKVLQGDVAVIAKDECSTMENVWKNLFIECKCQANPCLKSILEKAKNDAEIYGKWGCVCFVKKQKQGHKATSEIVILSKRANELLFGATKKEVYDIHEFKENCGKLI